jgi:hypothetical protein
MSLPKPGRPEAIGTWVKGGRSTTRKPELKPEHSKDWWKWWDSMAPSWRERNESGRLIREKTGEWGVLVKPGGNGMLTALLCLGWWLQKDGKASTDWMAAILNVKWVLNGLLSAAK